MYIKKAKNIKRFVKMIFFLFMILVLIVISIYIASLNVSADKRIKVLNAEAESVYAAAELYVNSYSQTNDFNYIGIITGDSTAYPENSIESYINRYLCTDDVIGCYYAVSIGNKEVKYALFSDSIISSDDMYIPTYEQQREKISFINGYSLIIGVYPQSSPID